LIGGAAAKIGDRTQIREGRQHRLFSGTRFAKPDELLLLVTLHGVELGRGARRRGAGHRRKARTPGQSAGRAEVLVGVVPPRLT